MAIRLVEKMRHYDTVKSPYLGKMSGSHGLRGQRLHNYSLDAIPGYCLVGITCRRNWGTSIVDRVHSVNSRAGIHPFMNTCFLMSFGNSMGWTRLDFEFRVGLWVGLGQILGRLGWILLDCIGFSVGFWIGSCRPVTAK